MPEPMTAADRIATVLAVAGRELNDEMTIIATSLTEVLGLLPPDHPARHFLADALAAAQRCCWKSSAMLNYASRRGALRTAAQMEHLLAQGVL